MNKSSIFIDSDFDYKSYLKEFKLNELLGEDFPSNDISSKNILPEYLNVDENYTVPFQTEYDDLIRLHFICRLRKVSRVLEFGVGKSSVIFADALRDNKAHYHDFSSKNLRGKNLYECHSIDNNQQWIEKCKKLMPKDFIKDGLIYFHQAKLITSLFNDRVCTFYDPVPNLCPDLIYLDGPDQFSPIGDIRGISTKHSDRMPMSADILSFEHFLQPGTLIIVDGRTANARFLKSNFQRNWNYIYNEDWDQHFFELLEMPLGQYNKDMIDFNLGDDYYQRLNSLSEKL
tara:strand:- start:5290 stop:6150 length:861 start_codon:yes stop_codon:yes gene_type:complete